MPVESLKDCLEAGLGKGVPANATVSLIAPTLEISQPLQRMTLSGVEVEFQLTPGTEAPAEMNIYFPVLRALCMAENATHVQHNVLTLRGALVRDALEAIRGYVGTGGVVNMSATDHMGLDLSAFRMLEVKNGTWSLVK